MRNDVKLGFAIGGVLLAVVIVFALVNSGNPPADPVADSSVQADAGKPTEPVTPGSPSGSPAPAASASTSMTPTGTTASMTPAETTTLTPPVEPIARTTTPIPAGQSTDPWTDALANGKLPTMMNNATTPSGNAGTPSAGVGAAATTDTRAEATTPRKPITVPANTTETKAASSNTRAALHDGVNDRSINSARVTLPDSRNQPDADRVLREYKSTAGKTGTSDTSAGASISTPAKTVLTARTHTIKSGETFSTIATSYYGNIRHAKLIARANPGVDSSRLKIGQVINLPAYDSSAEAAASAKANTPATIDTTREYRVQSGDSLHSIAVKLYGDPKKVESIYSLNKTAIGENPAKLKLGMVLNLPAQPSVAKK